MRTLGASRMTWKPENCRQNVYLRVDCTQCADWKWVPKCKRLKLKGAGQEKLLRVRVSMCVRACVCVCVCVCVWVCVCEEGMEVISEDSLVIPKRMAAWKWARVGSKISVYICRAQCVFFFLFYHFIFFLFFFLCICEKSRGSIKKRHSLLSMPSKHLPVCSQH